MKFAVGRTFGTLDDQWNEDENGQPIRTLKKVSLHDGDVSAVAYPAYPDTELSARSLEEVENRGREALGKSAEAAAAHHRDLLRRKADLAALE